MMRGQLKKVISVRDLLRNMRTHSVLAVGSSVALVTVLCGSIAANVLGAIEADASAIQTETESISMQVEEEALVIEAFVEELRGRMERVQGALNAMEQAITSGQEALKTIGHAVGEINSIDKPVKEALSALAEQMETVQRYIDTDRALTREVLLMTEDVQGITPAGKEELEILEEKVNRSTETVARHFTVLSADVSAMTEKLRTYEVKAKPFTEAVSVLEETFAVGINGATQAREAIGKLPEEQDDTTTMMLARLQMSVGGMGAISDSVDASGEAVEALCDRMQTSNDTLYLLQQEIAQTGVKLAELTTAMDDVSSEIRSMQEQVSGAVQAGEAGRNEAVRLGIEQQEALLKAASDQQEALDATYLKQQELLAQAMADQQSALERAAAEHTRTLEEASLAQQEMIEKSVAGARGKGYVRVSFSFAPDKTATSYTFDFSGYLSNYDAITKDDILVRNFHVKTVGTKEHYMEIVANIDMDQASYDPSTGRLVVTQSLMQTVMFSPTGTVTFAVVGGILK